MKQNDDDEEVWPQIWPYSYQLWTGYFALTAKKKKSFIINETIFFPKEWLQEKPEDIFLTVKFYPYIMFSHSRL